VMIGSPLASAYEAPGRGFHWGMATGDAALPRGARIHAGRKASLSEIIIGPAHENDGTLNLFGALRTSMATTGYETVKEHVQHILRKIGVTDRTQAAVWAVRKGLV